ncbi:MAG: NAD(+) diphosphatase, partial [Xanthomonadales bacterium]|nr:NAD(+) diphosphatase [Xanthomonadales bacterium]
DDADWVERALQSGKAHFVPLWRSRSLLQRTPDGTLAVYLRGDDLSLDALAQAPTLLGTDDKRIYFAASITDRQRDRLLQRQPRTEFADLRLASIDMDAKHAGILAYAKALHYWQHRHQFCGVCGSPNRLLSTGHRLECSNEECARATFPRIDPAIIVLVSHGDHCMLGRNRAWPEKRFSTLAGFVEPGESLEDAVAREVWEESGVRLERIRYVSSQPWPFPASAMCGFFAEATDMNSRSSEELAELRWFTPDSLRDAVLADDVRLSPPVSIAFQLLAEWYRRQCGEELTGLWPDRGAVR